LYDFRQLSPADFEDLTRDLLQEEWGVRLEAFKTGRDQGIDLRYTTIPGEATIIQCKHYAMSTVAKLVQHLRTKERRKVERLAPTRYVLVTSVLLNPADKDRIVAALQPFVHGPQDVLGANDMNNLLGRHTAIETQHFKLWMSSTAVLQNVLHNATRVQTEFDVQRVISRIPLYVQTSNYGRALHILEEHRVVIISGPPGIGKTTLADMLLFAHLEAGYQPVTIKGDIKEAKDVFRRETPQIFYFDDFLGQTFLGNRFDFLGKREDAAILDFLEHVARSKHARFILTTREHILRHALLISEHFRRRRLDLAQEHFLLTLDQYSALDRARILYNHIHCCDLPGAYKRALLRNGFYFRIIKHRNFNPRLIEWLARYTNVKQVPARGYQREVMRVLENPEELWRIAFEQQISEAARSALLALYTLGGDTPLPILQTTWQTLHERRAHKYNCTWNPQDWRQALHDLEGGFLTYEGGRARFINPSVKDFLDTTITTDREHITDILGAANEFTQVLTLWSLALSDKGRALQEYFREAPDRLFDAAQRQLNQQYEPRKHWGSTHVTRPESRLATMLSIADATMAEAFYTTATAYTSTVTTFWQRYVPDVKAATGVLRDLEHAHWSKLRNSTLHETIKRAMLDSLSSHPSAEHLARIATYAEETERWRDDDQRRLDWAFDRYRDGNFATELAEATGEAELYDLRENLDLLGHSCGVDVRSHTDLINDRIAELASEDDDQEPPVRLDPGPSADTPPEMQDAEIRRLFDGLL